jgi:hypothetical protein
MRTILAGAASLALVIPAALSAQANPAQPQQTADQANGQAQTPPPTTRVVPAPAPGQPATVVNNNPGNLAAPAPEAFNKTYPVCTRSLQDNCQNRGEGGAPGRSSARIDRGG